MQPLSPTTALDRWSRSAGPVVKGVGPGVKRGQAGVIKSGWIGVVQRGDAVRQDQWSGRAGVGGGYERARAVGPNPDGRALARHWPARRKYFTDLHFAAFCNTLQRFTTFHNVSQHFTTLYTAIGCPGWPWVSGWGEPIAPSRLGCPRTRKLSCDIQIMIPDPIYIPNRIA